MSKLDSFFADTERAYCHPVLRHLDAMNPDLVTIEVQRPKDVLGLKPAKLYLHIVQAGESAPPLEYMWDDELNAALIQRGVKGVDEDNEKLRFGLTLGVGFRKPETRYGDGFFNAVLAKFVRESEFKDFPDVADVLKEVHANQPYMGGRGSYEDCRALIDSEIRNRAKDLIQLGYPQPTAEEILAGALARYIDERFTVSDRRRLGWT